MTRQPHIACFFLCAWAIMVSPIMASAATLTIKVEGDVPAIGDVRVRVFQSMESFFRGEPIREIVVPAEGPGQVIEVPDLDPGRCIVSVHHDRNRDGKRNTNAFGVPIESMAFATPDGLTRIGVRLRDAAFDLDVDTLETAAMLPEPFADPHTLGVGVMAMVASSPYRGAGSETRVLPMLTYVGERFFLLGPRAGYNLRRDGPFSASMVAEFDFGEDAFDDSADLEGMKSRDETMLLGLEAGLRLWDRWRIEAVALSDVLGRHDGQRIRLSLSRVIRTGSTTITPGVGVNYHSSNFNGFYYGVANDETAPGRPAYRPGSSLGMSLHLLFRHEFDASWSLFAISRLNLLPDEITDSPVIDDDTEASAMMGVSYSF